MKVITYQAPNGATINLTPDQEETYRRAHYWPRNPIGEEYCSVSHGLHYGEPTMSDDDVALDIAENA